MIVTPPPHLDDHRRVVVYGVTGSGKSTLARRLSCVTGIPHVPVDDLMWRPGWVQLEPAEQVEAIRPVVAQEAWLLDALWTATRPFVLERTDLVVALDYPRWLSLRRLLWRTLTRLVTREPVCGGNTESWRQAFSRDSIVAWHFRSFSSRRATISRWSADAGGPPVVRFTHPSEATAWLRSLPSSRPDPGPTRLT